VTDNNAKKTDNLEQQIPPSGTGDDSRLQVLRPAGQADIPNIRKQNAHDKNSDGASSPQNFGAGQRAHQDQQAQHGQAGQFEEDLSTFFRDRRLIIKSSLDVMPILAGIGKLLIVSLVCCALFLFFWNYSASLRVKIQRIGIEKFNINFAQELPSWTRKAKQFKVQNNTELGQFHMRDGRAKDKVSIISSDPLISSIARGYWPKFERAVLPNCSRWQVSKECGLKAWYLAYKGSRASLKPITSLDMSLVQKLPKLEQSLMLFAMSQAVLGPRSDELFDQAIQVASYDEGLKKAIFDAKIKSIVRESQLIALPRVMSIIPKMKAHPADFLKWGALEATAKFKIKPIGLDKKADAAARKQLSDLMRRDASSLKTDPVALVILAPHMLRLGMAQELATVVEAVAAQENPRDFDPGLYREISIFAIRAHMLKGQLSEAIERANVLNSRLGPDATTQHLLGSTLLATKNPSSAKPAAIAFKRAVTGQKNWQSEVGYFLALTRSGQLAEAERMLPGIQKYLSSSNSIWIKIALAEFKLMRAKASSKTSAGSFSFIASELAPIYAKNQAWPTLSELYVSALFGAGQSDLARKVQSIADQQSERVRYVGSTEFLASPFGPYALMR
jgi:hypothetical protein